MEVLDLLKLRLEEAEDEVRRLRAAIAALDPENAHPAATRRPTAGNAEPLKPRTELASTRGLGRRRRRTVTATQLLKLIPTEGIARAELDALSGAPGSAVLAALKQLEADGLARRESQRGATRWFPVNTRRPHQ
jgi:hypothetical protein